MSPENPRPSVYASRLQATENKTGVALELRDLGVFLIDLQEDPVDGTPLAHLAPNLVRRCSELNSRRIVLIKATVFDAAYVPLKRAGLPVIPERIPFPGSGRQREFEVAFRRALEAEQTSTDRPVATYQASEGLGVVDR